jgi:alpha-glucoside transport system permease protein
MQTTAELRPGAPAPVTKSTINPTRLLIALLGLAVTVALLWLGFDYLRDPDLPRLIVGLIAILWGVGGVALLFTTANMVVEAFTERWQRRIQPYIFVGPAVALLAWFLLIPTLRTLWQSFFDATGTNFVGLKNFGDVFTDSRMLQALVNNLMWLIFGTTGCVVVGLLIAVLADRSRFENIAKALIFLPMAISFVGAGIIWRFVYDFSPPGAEQMGLLNAIVTALGGAPQAWITNAPGNTFFLIIVLIWMQAGFALVIFSAALKGVPGDLLEAARLDGANELQVFFRVIIPYIAGTIVTVTTTIAIFTLKIFDVVYAMSAHQYGGNVVATQFYDEFRTREFGRSAAIVMVLFLAVIPVMVYNLRQLRKQEGF